MLLLVLPVSLFGAEKKVKLKDAPAGVQKTVQEQIKGATMVGLTTEVENGKTVYELETKKDGKTRDLTMAADGTILSTEQEVTLDSIPAGAKAAFEKKAAGGKILKVETVQEGSQTAYEAEFLVKGKKSELKVDANGSPVK